MSDTAITATLDQARTLDVRPHLLELEKTTGVGVGRLVARVIQGEFAIADLIQTVRLGLIGGGATPVEASRLAYNYVEARPITEGHALATEVLLAAWHGTARAADEIAPKDDGLILDATGENPMRFEDDGTYTPVRAGPDGSFVPVEDAA